MAQQQVASSRWPPQNNNDGFCRTVSLVKVPEPNGLRVGTTRALFLGVFDRLVSQNKVKQPAIGSGNHWPPFVQPLKMAEPSMCETVRTNIEIHPTWSRLAGMVSQGTR